MSQHGCGERMSYTKGFQDEGASQATMEVLVETLTGTAFEMTVSPSDTIFAIKSKICRVEGIPVSQQHLLYNLKELDDASSLLAHGISDGARLRLVLGMRGGPISTRRLPPPTHEPWRDLERLLENNRDEIEWGTSGGCKVTVLVFRDGDRVNLLRVRENHDGTYSLLQHDRFSSSSSSYTLEAPSVGKCTLAQNAVTRRKMADLRRRMDNLNLRRGHHAGDEPEIQKTRSEETLSVPSPLDESVLSLYTPYSTAEDPYEGPCMDYGYDCSFAHKRYTLLPPIPTRTGSDLSVHLNDKVSDSEGRKLSGGIMLSGSRGGSSHARGVREETPLLETASQREHRSSIRHMHATAAATAADYGGRGGSSHARGVREETPLLETASQREHRSSIRHMHASAAATAADYGPVVHGWRVRGFGSSGELAPPPLPLAPPSPPPAPPLFSSSTSDLASLRRGGRLLPKLSRHRNTEHLHLSDDHLDAIHSTESEREIGIERRQRRIDKIQELDGSRLFRYSDSADTPLAAHRDGHPSPALDDGQSKEGNKEKRVRCGFCRKRLSIATVHKCRCGDAFCAPHRYAEVHGCLYDYKAHAQTQRPFELHNPKLPKI